MAIAGLILGIASIFCGFFPLLQPWGALIALPMAIVGLCLSVSAGKKAKAAGASSGVATAGLIVGIIAVVCASICFITCGVCGLCALCAANEIADAANGLF